MDMFDICISPFVFLKCVSFLINLEYKIIIEEKLFPNSKDPNIRCKMETAMKVFAMLCQYIAYPEGKRNVIPRDYSKYSRRFDCYKSYTISRLESSIKTNKKEDLFLLVLKYFLESYHIPNKKVTLKEISDREHHPFFSENQFDLKGIKSNAASKYGNKAMIIPRKTGICNSEYSEYREKELKEFRKSLIKSTFKEEYQNEDKRKEIVEEKVYETMQFNKATKDQRALVAKDTNARVCDVILIEKARKYEYREKIILNIANKYRAKYVDALCKHITRLVKKEYDGGVSDNSDDNDSDFDLDNNKFYKGKRKPKFLLDMKKEIKSLCSDMWSVPNLNCTIFAGVHFV